MLLLDPLYPLYPLTIVQELLSQYRLYQIRSYIYIINILDVFLYSATRFLSLLVAFYRVGCAVFFHLPRAGHLTPITLQWGAICGMVIILFLSPSAIESGQFMHYTIFSAIYEAYLFWHDLSIYFARPLLVD